MVAITKVFAASLGLFPLAAQATRLFYNSGTKVGWDQVFTEKSGTVDDVTNIVYEGSTALKMTQTFIPGASGRYHSEVRHYDGYQRGDELFYGFMFRLSENWEFQDQSYNLAQFIANREGAGCGGDDWMPSSMIWLEGDRLRSRFLSGRYRRGDCNRPMTGITFDTPITRGVWHKVIIQARWKSDNTGFYKIWLDGVKKEHYDVATTTEDDFNFEFRIGLYANGWGDQGQMAGTQGFRQVWFDEIAIGTTFKDVDPDQS
ncbi:polysaccharide lyase family 20 protein [Paramyrothecium foliicola]|nr:polysaccharide lyase family 20 protein [Paramyrothecium foliicola]